jgi:cytochrome c peroxidase
MQALGPFENDKEFGSSRLHVAHRIQDAYGGDYQRVFGGRYPLPDLSTLPASGKPGDAKWDELGVTERDAVTRIYVNVGKAIAAFERTLRAKPNALDRYADGDKAALTEAQKGALVTFFSVGCHQCHWGPRLTDDAFHTLRFPTGRQDNAADRGRIDILPTLASAEFVATSRWSDDPTAAKLLAFDSTPSMLGAFRTPALRGIAQTAPYGHGGQFATLLEVAKHYGQRAAETRSEQAAGAVERWVPNFDTTAQASLPTFLEVLTVE